MQRAVGIYAQGSAQDYGFQTFPGPFPHSIRPSMWLTHRSTGYQLLFGVSGDPLTTLGASNTDCFDALAARYTDAQLATFIQSGMGGSVPRPELTGDDVADLVYWIKRSSLSGSFSNPVHSRAPFQADTTAPNFVGPITCTRLTNDAFGGRIQVQWTTDKPTYGFAAAGFAGGHGTATPYHIYALESYAPGSLTNIAKSYNTSHSVILSGLLPGGTVYIRAIAKDMAGNNSISAEQTVT
jgi:hypothetical protein